LSHFELISPSSLKLKAGSRNVFDVPNLAESLEQRIEELRIMMRRLCTGARHRFRNCTY
jgi:hypothetical protein